MKRSMKRSAREAHLGEFELHKKLRLVDVHSEVSSLLGALESCWTQSFDDDRKLYSEALVRLGLYMTNLFERAPQLSEEDSNLAHSLLHALEKMESLQEEGLEGRLRRLLQLDMDEDDPLDLPIPIPPVSPSLDSPAKPSSLRPPRPRSVMRNLRDASCWNTYSLGNIRHAVQGRPVSCAPDRAGIELAAELAKYMLRHRDTIESLLSNRHSPECFCQSQEDMATVVENHLKDQRGCNCLLHFLTKSHKLSFDLDIVNQQILAFLSSPNLGEALQIECTGRVFEEFVNRLDLDQLKKLFAECVLPRHTEFIQTVAGLQFVMAVLLRLEDHIRMDFVLNHAFERWVQHEELAKLGVNCLSLLLRQQQIPGTLYRKLVDNFFGVVTATSSAAALIELSYEHCTSDMQETILYRMMDVACKLCGFESGCHMLLSALQHGWVEAEDIFESVQGSIGLLNAALRPKYGCELLMFMFDHLEGRARLLYATELILVDPAATKRAEKLSFCDVFSRAKDVLKSASYAEKDLVQAHVESRRNGGELSCG